MRLVIATKNEHKVGEISKILDAPSLGLELVSYAGEAPAETGLSFEANALLKARAASAATGLPALADDSGLIVNAMGSAPGIFSAYWSGERDDAKNRALLLAQLHEIPESDRAAAFVCAVALVGASSLKAGQPEELTAIGEWQGSIAFEERGNNGFGYDSLFIPEGLGRTAAELEPEAKNQISHRARALKLLRDYLL